MLHSENILDDSEDADGLALKPRLFDSKPQSPKKKKQSNDSINIKTDLQKTQQCRFDPKDPKHIL